MSFPIDIPSRRKSVFDEWSTSPSDSTQSFSKSPLTPKSDPDDRVLQLIGNLNISKKDESTRTASSSLTGSPQTMGLALLEFHNLPTTKLISSPKESTELKKSSTFVVVKNSAEKGVKTQPNPIFGKRIIDRAITLLKNPGEIKLDEVIRSLDNLIVSKDLDSAIADLWRVSDKFRLIDAAEGKEKILMDVDKTGSDIERNKRLLTIFNEFNKRYGTDIAMPLDTPDWTGIEDLKNWFGSCIKRKLTPNMTRIIRSFGQERYTGTPACILLLNEYGLIKSKDTGIYAKCAVTKAQFTRIFLPMNRSQEVITLPVEFVGKSDTDVKRIVNWELTTDYSPEGKIERFRSKILPGTGAK